MTDLGWFLLAWLACSVGTFYVMYRYYGAAVDDEFDPPKIVAMCIFFPFFYILIGLAWLRRVAVAAHDKRNGIEKTK